MHGRPAEETELKVDKDSELDIGEVRARKKLIDAFKDPEDPLKLLDMLLTGFDAPVEQVMFLDKPLGAKLLPGDHAHQPALYPRNAARSVTGACSTRLEDAFAEFPDMSRWPPRPLGAQGGIPGPCC